MIELHCTHYIYYVCSPFYTLVIQKDSISLSVHGNRYVTTVLMHTAHGMGYINKYVMNFRFNFMHEIINLIMWCGYMFLSRAVRK